MLKKEEKNAKKYFSVSESALLNTLKLFFGKMKMLADF